MKTKEYPVASPPKPPRKARRKPITMREKGMDVASGFAMEKSEYPVASPPKPPRKARRKPITMREKGIDVDCRGGKFVILCEPKGTTPFVSGLRKISTMIYNEVADLKLLKMEVESALVNAHGERGELLLQGLASVNKRISQLRDLGYDYRSYILDVEGCKPLNEPREWARH